jgi:predicted nucleic-acid-binding Zn-ribbon protein
MSPHDSRWESQVPDKCPKCSARSTTKKWYVGPRFDDYRHELKFYCERCGYDFALDPDDRTAAP